MSKAKRGRVGEPVQVYLAPMERDRLLTLADQLGVSKSDVVRRSLAALERELSSPEGNPMLQLIGIIEDDDGTDTNGRDLAREHDAILVELNEPRAKRATRRKQRPS